MLIFLFNDNIWIISGYKLNNPAHIGVLYHKSKRLDFFCSNRIDMFHNTLDLDLTKYNAIAFRQR